MADISPLLTVHALSKSVPGPRLLFEGLDLEVGTGEVVAIVGESGVGKSTLLDILAGLDDADRGTVAIEGIALGGLDETARTRLRRERIGFVFQAFHVLPYLTLRQNVALPLVLVSPDGAAARAGADEVLEAVGLAGRGDGYARDLSGGELQRVAIARALVHRPALILADEPTGNLDPETAARVVDGDGAVTGVVSAIRDVGHRKAVERRLAHAAMTDGLTGIANRAAFDAQLALAIEAAGADGFGCVAIFDLDHFKGVNDRHGHAAGDAVLRAFAELARGRMRDMDFVARYGGEEFSVILPGATLEQARLVCDRLRAAIASAPVVVGDARIAVTVSGGVARYAGDVPAPIALAAADAALYEAKRAGRDRMRLAA